MSLIGKTLAEILPQSNYEARPRRPDAPEPRKHQTFDYSHITVETALAGQLLRAFLDQYDPERGTKKMYKTPTVKCALLVSIGNRGQDKWFGPSYIYDDLWPDSNMRPENYRGRLSHYVTRLRPFLYSQGYALKGSMSHGRKLVKVTSQ